MNAKQLSQWRTVGVVLLAFVVLLVGFRWAVGAPGGADLFAILRDGVVLLVSAAAFKSLGQHLGGGGGVRGAVSALLTEARPGEPPAPPGSPG